MALIHARTISHAAPESQATLQRSARRLAVLALLVSGGALPSAAWAQCSTSGSIINCSGSATFTTSSASNVTVNVASGATVTAPVAVSGTGNILNNAGTIAGNGTFPAVQFGDGAQVNITSTGNISSTAATAGSAAVSVGNGATVTDGGALASVAGTPAAQFGNNGTFILTPTVTAAVTGNIVFGASSTYNLAGETGTFTNQDINCTSASTSTACGLSGNVIAYGNIKVSNAGTWIGNFSQFTQYPAGSTVGTSTIFDNSAAGVFTGVFSTADVTTLTNEGTMYLEAGSALDSNNTGTSAGVYSSLVNTGSLTIGNASLPALLPIYGSFSQSATGILNISINPSGAATQTAGASYSQIYAQGPSGTINLNGTLNLTPGPGYYASGATYQVLLADQGITLGSAFKLAGNSLPFVSFCATADGSTCAASNNTVATIKGAQQAYEVLAQHTSDYAASLIAAKVTVNPNELAIARGLNPMIALANASPAGNEAQFLGLMDVSAAQDLPFTLDSLSPQGYYGYAIALRDQANAFERNIDLRLMDQNSNHDEDGWWMTAQGDVHLGGSTGYNNSERILGTSLGYDYSGPHHVYGVAMNVSWNTVDYAPQTMSGSNRDIALAAYEGANFGPLHITGQVQYNLGHMSANKTVVFNNSTGSPTDYYTNAGAGEHLIDANTKFGLDLKLSSYLFEPFAGVDWMHGQVNGFTENSQTQYNNAGYSPYGGAYGGAYGGVPGYGAPGNTQSSYTAGLPAAQLSVDPMSVNRTDLLTGFELTKRKGFFRPYLRAVYRSQISGGGSGVTGWFDGLSNAPFTVMANAEARHELDANAGVNWVFDDAGSLYVGYEDTIRNGLHIHGLNGGIRIEF